MRTKPEHVVAVRDPIAVKLRLDGSYPSVDGEKEYHVQRVPLGFALMLGAGTLSGLLGIGSGAMKVLAMDQAMCLPFKVSTTTSNFMIGVTAAASAGIYLARGYIDPGIAMPVMLGVLAGAALGVRILGAHPAKGASHRVCSRNRRARGGDDRSWRRRSYLTKR